MKTITIKNRTTYTDLSAMARIVGFLSGEPEALQDAEGRQVVRIEHRGDTYTISEVEG